ncbi:MAG: hypothetical protein JW938_06395 [Candidatus Omnitrophica bacterium]|nr:hypothetical protein [Candidatus Omnitrophota bacterium]
MYTTELRIFIAVVFLLSVCASGTTNASDDLCSGATLATLVDPSKTIEVVREGGLAKWVQQDNETFITDTYTVPITVETPDITIIPSVIVTAAMLSEVLKLSSADLGFSSADMLEYGVNTAMMMMALRQVQRQVQRLEQVQTLKLEQKQLSLAEGLMRLYRDAAEAGQEVQYSNKTLKLSFSYVNIKKDKLPDKDTHEWALKILDEMGGGMCLLVNYEGFSYYCLFVDGDMHPKNIGELVAIHEYGEATIHSLNAHFEATCLEFAAARKLGMFRTYLDWLIKNKPGKFGDVTRHVSRTVSVDLAEMNKERKEIFEKFCEFMGKENIVKEDEHVRALLDNFAWPPFLVKKVEYAQEAHDEAEEILDDLKRQISGYLSDVRENGIDTIPLKEVYWNVERIIREEGIKKIRRIRQLRYLNYVYTEKQWREVIHYAENSLTEIWNDLQNMFKGENTYRLHITDGLLTRNFNEKGIFDPALPLKDIVRSIRETPFVYTRSQWKDKKDYTVRAVLDERTTTDLPKKAESKETLSVAILTAA